MIRTWLRLLCRTLLFIGAQAVHAQSCTVSSSNLAFGVYNPQLALPNQSVATVTVTCSAVISILVGYTVSISTGGSGSYAARRMTTGASNMNYQIYSDLLRTKVWGDGTGGSFAVNDGYLINVLVPIVKLYPAYGQIPALQNAKPGSYGDSTVVTITY